MKKNRIYKVYVMFTEQEYDEIKANSLPEDKSLSGSVRRMLGLDKIIPKQELTELIQAIKELKGERYLLNKLENKINIYQQVEKYGFKEVRKCIQEHSGRSEGTVKNFMIGYKI